jgi:uncharacterized repeat protein (TIGR03806 family)
MFESIHSRSSCSFRSLLGLALLGSAACGGDDVTQIFDAALGSSQALPAPYLNFPAQARRAPTSAADADEFPRLLSDTGAFLSTAQLKPGSGLVPYDLQAPLWSDGAYKRRWLSLPDPHGVRVQDDAPWQVPPGTVFVKHFEMALDERAPDQRRRLETRLLVAAQSGSFYGVTYKWNSSETDAEIVLEAQTEVLRVVDADGAEREQPYFYPGPRDCISCHTSSAGYVLGLRTRQLNHDFAYASGQPALNELLAWSDLGLLDRNFSEADLASAPRLANISDESASLELRVRSYWDSNCSMCHAGNSGSVAGWDARFSTPMAERGLDRAPQMTNPDLPSVLLEPGSAQDSYIYLRSASVDKQLRMPPLGRNKIDATYVDVLSRWIDSL